MLRSSRFWEKFPFLSRFIFFIAVPILFLLLVLAIFVLCGGPSRSGELRLSGLNEAAIIHRVEGTVPRIEATTEHDAYFALGLLHAQDRLWEMEMLRRTGAGRLSEVFGKEAYASDLLMRHLRLYANAKKIWLNLDAKNKLLLQSYVDGVNAGIRDAKVLPLDYYINSFQPEPWVPADSLVLLQLMAWSFSGNASDELRRLLLINKYNFGVANELLSGIPIDIANGLPASTAVIAKENLNTPISSLPHDAPRNSIAYRGWVVARGWGVQGLPVLGSDTLPPSPLPVSWHFSEMKSNKLAISGATLPGLPIFFFGRNARVAWTLAGATADTQDLILEEINPLDSNQYKSGDVYEEMELGLDTIHLKKQFLRPASRPQEILLRRTRNGAVISDIPGISEDKVLALRWTGDDDTGGTFAGLMRMNHAANWHDFDLALSTHVTPVYSFLYADIDGNIAYLAPGLYPIRSSGNGTVPIRGTGTRPVWQGFVDYSAIPRTVNPSEGFLAIEKNTLSQLQSWNSRPAATAARTSLPPSSSAANRATQPFSSTEIVAPGRASDEALSRMRAIKPASAQQLGVLQALKKWDGRLREEGMLPAIYVAWRSRLRQAILAGLPANGAAREPSDAYLVDEDLVERLMTARGDQWCNVDKRSSRARCDGLLEQTLAAALVELTALIGADEGDWSLASLCQAGRRRGEGSNGELPAANRFLNRVGSASDAREHDFTWTCVRQDQFINGVFRQISGVRADTAGKRWLVDLGPEESPLPPPGMHLPPVPIRPRQPGGLAGVNRSMSENQLFILPLTKENR